jgi:uncharacterized protein
MKSALAGGLAGALFAAGLILAGMLQPARILGSLDIERWNPSMVLTLLGALAVLLPAQILGACRLRKPLLGGRMPPAPRKDIDAGLIVGSALFGVGWGLGGYCPGSGLIAFATGNAHALVFVLTMLEGMVLFQLWAHRGKGLGAAAAVVAKGAPCKPSTRTASVR